VSRAVGALPAADCGHGSQGSRSASETDARHRTAVPRNLEIGLRCDLQPSTARALFVDDWIDTGGQAVAARRLFDAAAATWCGASVIVDALEDPPALPRP
jgi:adenine/guanine phosphoribosyltransferase-like PRPP-binding protein